MAGLAGDGLQPDESLVVDVFFYADGWIAAAVVDEALQALGFSVIVDTRRKGFLRRGRLWSVTGTTTLRNADEKALNDLSGRMEVLAREHGVEFDGWGTEID